MMFVVRGRNSWGRLVMTTPPGRVNTPEVATSGGNEFVRREAGGRIGFPRGPFVDRWLSAADKESTRTTVSAIATANGLVPNWRRVVMAQDITVLLMWREILRNLGPVGFQ